MVEVTSSNLVVPTTPYERAVWRAAAHNQQRNLWIDIN